MNIYRAVEQKFLSVYGMCFDRYFATMPVFVCLGVVLCVSGVLPGCELSLSLSICCGLLCVWLIAGYAVKALILPMVMIAVGILVASVHVEVAKKKNSTCRTSGRSELIVSIDHVVYGARFYVFGTLTSIDGARSDCRVKVAGLEKVGIDLYGIEPGDLVNMVGAVHFPSPPLYPRLDKVFMERLAGKMFVIRAQNGPVVVTKGSDMFGRIRSRIAGKINRLSVGGQKSGYGVIGALTIGNTGYIEEKDLENIRRSGFAHLLAISGLHLGIVVGVVFGAVRYLLAMIPYVCLRFNTKKIAAAVAIVVSFCYVQITSGSISVQRSFIMCSLLLAGILFDRKAITFRIWSLAMFYVVTLMPDKIFMPSMQMSFVATFTLIAVYQKFSRDDSVIAPVHKGSFLFYIFTIFVSSFVAGFATMFYEAYHFGQWSLIGLLSNEFAIPVTEFFLLPVSMLAVVFDGTVAGDVLYGIAGRVGDVLIFLANFFASFKFSYVLVKAMPPCAILLITIGLVAVFVTLNRWSAVGMVAILLGVFIHYMAPKKSIFVDKSGRHIVYLGGDQKYYTNREIDNKFMLRVLSQELAQESFEVAKDSQNFKCKKGICAYRGNNFSVCVVDADADRFLSDTGICDDKSIVIDFRKSPQKKSHNAITARQIRRAGSFVM